jgi:hypothetical protein
MFRRHETTMEMTIQKLLEMVVLCIRGLTNTRNEFLVSSDHESIKSTHKRVGEGDESQKLDLRNLHVSHTLGCTTKQTRNT